VKNELSARKDETGLIKFLSTNFNKQTTGDQSTASATASNHV